MISVYITDLGAYNAGELRGEWVALPMNDDKLDAIIARYSRDGEGDYFVSDTEFDSALSNLRIGEYSDIRELNACADQLQTIRADELARINYLLGEGETLASAIENADSVQYCGETMRDVAQSLLDDGCFGEIPAALANYIDVDAIARDLQHDGYDETDAGVFRRD